MSPTRITPKAAVAALLAAGAFATPAAAQSTVLSQEAAPTPVAAWDGTVVWSTLDEATGDYALVASVDGEPAERLDVPLADKPFDVDLGTDRRGATTAVYTRGGDLYRLTLDGSPEQRLQRFSSRSSERSPSIMHGRIAFVRRVDGQDVVLLGDTRPGAGAPRLLRAQRPVRSLELGDRHLALVEQAGSARRVVIKATRRNGPSNVIHTARSGGLNYANVTRPSVTEDLGAFVFARTNLGSQTGNRVVKYTLRGSKLSYALGSTRYASTAWAGGSLGLATFNTLTSELSGGVCEEAGVRYCEVGLTGPLSFTATKG